MLWGLPETGQGLGLIVQEGAPASHTHTNTMEPLVRALEACGADVMAKRVTQLDTSADLIMHDVTGFVKHASRVAVLCGKGAGLRDLAATLSNGSATNPHAVVVAKGHFFSFSKSELKGAPAFLRVWYNKNVVEGGQDVKECVVCLHDAGDYHASCRRCCARACPECFPNLTTRPVGGSMYTCPCCLKETYATDVVQPLIDAASAPRPIFRLLSLSLERFPDRRSRIIISTGPWTLVADAKLSQGGHVFVITKHYQTAKHLMFQKGTIVGVGPLVPYAERKGGWFKPDDRGAAFIMVDGKHALPLRHGWSYVNATSS